jgi:hypothetical protein
MPILNLEKQIDNFKKVDISLYYSLGGMNYFNNKEEKRGYYIHFFPCNIEEKENGIFCKMVEPMHSRSFKLCIKTATRKSHKVMDDLMNTFANKIHEFKKAYEESNEAAIELIKETYSGR